MGLLTCKNRLPYNLHCVGGDVKHCSIQCEQQTNIMHQTPSVKLADYKCFNDDTEIKHYMIKTGINQ